MQFDIEIETFEKSLEFELFETDRLTEETKRKSIVDGVIIEYKWTEFKKAIGFPDIIFLMGVISNIGNIIKFAYWLYNKLKNRNVVKLKINWIEVEVDEEKIKDIMTEQMRSSE